MIASDCMCGWMLVHPLQFFKGRLGCTLDRVSRSA